MNVVKEKLKLDDVREEVAESRVRWGQVTGCGLQLGGKNSLALACSDLPIVLSCMSHRKTYDICFDYDEALHKILPLRNTRVAQCMCTITNRLRARALTVPTRISGSNMTFNYLLTNSSDEENTSPTPGKILFTL